jgi:hypothetical protein
MKKEVEGILKYEDLEIVLQSVKCETENDTNYHKCDWNFVKNVSEVRTYKTSLLNTSSELQKTPIPLWVHRMS